MLKQTHLEIVPLILCGGVGKRLWPLSREEYPKQLLPLYNSKTLLQNTLLRLRQLPWLEKPILICNKRRRFSVQSQIAEINAAVLDLMLEPRSLNTAPAIALAALHARRKYGPVLLLALPSDHKIDDLQRWSEALQAAVPLALNDKIVTFGVKPQSPHTQYGYLEAGEKTGEQVYAVKRFAEKPDRSTAQAFVKQGNYYWNSGIFLFSVDRVLRDFKKLHPDILEQCAQALDSSKADKNQIFIDDSFKNCHAISFDHAIMEKAQDVYMVELQSDWTDIGNWRQLYDLDQKDPQGNVLHGNIVSLDNRNCYIRTTHSLVASLGMENCYIVETRDATLVAHGDHLDKLPQLVKELEDHQRSEALTPATSHRPWGYFTCIENESHFQIKKIVIFPHQRISLQEHQHRSEHWVILKGKATIILGHETYQLGPNQSTYVPIGVRHQIINEEDSNLELIEVQMGSYLGEDDIKRVDDIYQRDTTDT